MVDNSSRTDETRELGRWMRRVRDQIGGKQKKQKEKSFFRLCTQRSGWGDDTVGIMLICRCC